MHKHGAQVHELIDAIANRLAEAKVGAEVTAVTPQWLARECLRTITSFGFELRLSSDENASNTLPAGLAKAADKLRSSGKLRLRELLDVWRQFAKTERSGSPTLYAEIGQRVLKSGEPLLAYDILQMGLRLWPSDLRLQQLLSLALARSGAPASAAKRLRQLVDEGHDDEETLSLLARTKKDAWESEPDASKRREHLCESHRLYRKGFEHATAKGSADGAIYAGINTATTALLLGDADSANLVASQVIEICHSKADTELDYWAIATLGECSLILGRLEAAASHYRAAVDLAGTNYADIASTRRNAAILFEHLLLDQAVLAEWFPVPNVAVFTGHMIDRPDSGVRFPHVRVDAVRSQIAACLKRNRVGFGYSAAANGGDLLFLAALEQLGSDSHIVLPFNKEMFASVSVAGDASYDWEKEFNAALDRAAHVMVVNDFSRSVDPLQFEYTNQVMTGLAILHARALGAEIVPIAVWDGKPPRGPGGTGALVELWQKLGWTPQIIDPLREPGNASPVPPKLRVEPDETDEVATHSNVVRKEIRAMMFADVVGYSKLTEEEIPLFIEEFMKRVAASVAAMGIKIETWNTWGDAIFFVFRDVEDAGRTALQITELVSSIDWMSLGFSRQLNLRTGLHVGPVYRLIDPITRTWTHTGAHVSRAARIEPIAPLGEVYASDAFAAVAAAENVTSFRCDYVGVTPMAKGYGEFPTYHVRREGQ